MQADEWVIEDASEQNVNAIRSCLEYLYGEALRAELPFTAKLIHAAAQSIAAPDDTGSANPPTYQ